MLHVLAPSPAALRSAVLVATAMVPGAVAAGLASFAVHAIRPRRRTA